MASPLLHAKTHPPAKRLSLAHSFNKTDANNGSNGIWWCHRGFTLACA
jgi:hypothetical protein